MQVCYYSITKKFKKRITLVLGILAYFTWLPLTVISTDIDNVTHNVTLHPVFVKVNFSWKLMHFQGLLESLKADEKDTIYSPVFINFPPRHFNVLMAIVIADTPKRKKHKPINIYVYVRYPLLEVFEAEVSLYTVDSRGRLINKASTRAVFTPNNRGKNWTEPAVFKDYTSVSKLIHAKRRLLNNTHFNIVGEIKGIINTVHKDYDCAIQPQPPPHNFFTNRLEMFLEGGEDETFFSDVTILVNERRYHLHKLTLMTRSTVLNKLLNDEEGFNSNLIIMQNFDEEIVRHLILFMYTGKVDDLGSNLHQLWNASYVMGIDGLKEACERILCKQITKETAFSTFVYASEMNASQLADEASAIMKSQITRILELPDLPFWIDKSPKKLKQFFRTIDYFS